MPHPEPRQALSATLRGLLATPDGRPAAALLIGDIVDAVRDKGFGLLFIILSLPSALPVPAAGYSTPFGIIILVLGAQMLAGRTQPGLPRRARRLSLGPRMAARMLGAAESFFRRIEHLIRPRLSWVNTRGGRACMALLVMLMALLMCLPIPSTNTAPAMVVFLVGVGLCENDGLFAIGACLAGVLAAALYACVIYFAYILIAQYGWEGLERLTGTVRDFLRGLFGA